MLVNYIISVSYHNPRRLSLSRVSAELRRRASREGGDAGRRAGGGLVIAKIAHCLASIVLLMQGRFHSEADTTHVTQEALCVTS